MNKQILTDFLSGGEVITLFLILLITLVTDFTSRFILKKIVRVAAKTHSIWDDVFINSVGAPLHLLVWIVGITFALEASGYLEGTAFDKVVSLGRDLGVIIVLSWFLNRFIKRVHLNLVGKVARSGKKIDASVADTVSKLLRFMVIILAVLFAMQTLGFSIAGILTFGGIGGIALGFAAKDMLANFFGGLIIYLDGPFKIGDWIRSPDREIEGIVEEIGWRITLVRNFDSRPLYIPNSSFSTISIENVSRMENRRIYEIIGIRYDDVKEMNHIIEQVREYLENHKDLDHEKSTMVSFTTFSPSSLDFFIYCYTRTQSGPVYYRVKQEILLHILDIIEKNGAECAFPTTTIHLSKSDFASLAEK